MYVSLKLKKKNSNDLLFQMICHSYIGSILYRIILRRYYMFSLYFTRLGVVFIIQHFCRSVKCAVFCSCLMLVCYPFAMSRMLCKLYSPTPMQQWACSQNTYVAERGYQRFFLRPCPSNLLLKSCLGR